MMTNDVDIFSAQPGNNREFYDTVVIRAVLPGVIDLPPPKVLIK
jgi:hypothetical protein